MRKLALSGWIRRRATMLVAVASVGGITLFLTFFQLGTLVPGANRYEDLANIRMHSLSSSLGNPINLPYYLVARFFDLFFSSTLALRITSALFGITIIWLLCYVMRQWFNNRVAIAGTLFIVTSSWYLFLARTGAPFIMSAFWMCLLIAIGSWRTYTTKPLLTDALIVTAAALSLYTPYYIWMLAAGLVVLTLRRRKQFFLLPRKHQWLLPVIFLVLTAPLIYACVHYPSILKELTGLYDLPSTFYLFFKQGAQNIAQVALRGYMDPALALGRLAILDIFSVVMVVLGMYYFERRLHLRRSQLLFIGGFLLLAILSLSPFSIGKLAILFPIIMLFAVGGVVELLTRWLNSFPRNPIARSVGVCIIVIAISFASYYHLQRYFVAWAGNPTVVQEQSRQLR